MENEKSINKNTFFNKLIRILGIDLKYFTHNSFYIILGNLFLALYGFLTTVIFTRFCSQTIYGQFNYIISFISILQIFSLPGFQTAISESTSKGYGKSFIKGTIYRILGSIFIVPISIFLSFYFFYLGNNNFFIIFLLFSFISPIYFVLTNYIYYITALKKFKLDFFFNLTFSLIGFLTMYLLILNFSYNIIILIMGYFSLNLGFNAIFWIISYFKNKKNQLNNNIDNKLFNYGIFISFIDLISILYLHLDALIIGSFLNFDILAIFSIALKFPDFFKNTVKSISLVLIPKLGERYPKKIFLSKKNIALSIFLGIISVFILIIVIPFLIPTFFSMKYNESIVYSQLYSFSFLFIFLDINIFDIFIIEKRNKFISIRNILYPCIYITSFFILYIFFGLLGIIIAHVFSNNLIYLISFILYKLRK